EHALFPEDPAATPRPALEQISLPEIPAAPPPARAPSVSRRSTRHPSVRPRAAMQQVQAMYVLLLPLCLELIPLPVERRSRRFWARWREVAGDRGVRREVLEALLRSARDPRTLLCGLIAEMLSVDLGSVEALVQRLERDTDQSALQSTGPGRPSAR